MATPTTLDWIRVLPRGVRDWLGGLGMFNDKVLEFIRLNPKKANPTTCREYLQLKLSLSGEANGLMHLYLAAAIQLTFCQDEKASTESDMSVGGEEGIAPIQTQHS